MIIGGGLLQIPVIQTAKKMGYQIIVTDYNPDAIGMKYADIPITMSTRDIAGSVRVAKSQNKLTPISGVLTVGTDASMTVAAVANALNLPGIKFEDAEAATNKIHMRSRFKEHNVPSVEFRAVWTLSEAKDACKKLGLPVVIKPSDNMGARGVMLIENLNSISDAFHSAKSASPSGEIIIEQYMPGPELSIDAVIYKGEVTFTGIADRIIEDLPYFIEKGHNMPSALPEKDIEEAKRVMTLGIRALGLNHGFAKGDIKVTPEGVKIGEIAARLSGGFMSTHTFPYSTGIDLMKAAIEISTGQEPGNLEPLFNRVSIERSIITEPGIIKKITGLDEAKNIDGIDDIFMDAKPGDRMVKPTSNVDKAGHIIATADTLDQAEEIIAKAKKLINIEIDTEGELSMDMIFAAAREKFNKVCFVCKECDGTKCPSSVPGMGGAGQGHSFKRNIDSLNQIKIITRVIHGVSAPDTSVDFLGEKLSMPVMTAPITGTVTNMNGATTEEIYNDAVTKGSRLAGTIAFLGDGATPSKYKIGLDAVKRNHGKGIPIFKPRTDDEEIYERIKEAEIAGAIAVGMDIDATTIKTMKLRNQSTSPKDLNKLREIISSTKLPFVLKGIMHPEDAELAVKAGAKAIIVGNHGGRILDHMPGAIDVLEEISKAVKNDVTIIADGGFRSGVDIFKGIASGAHLVSIGRPVCFAAVGMEERGVEFYLNHLKKELEKTMILTGTSKITDISREHIRHIH
ncbi:MAG: alpha-hydroxy-acid oxidizing protein [Spirochaetes bacterium]|nr:alpha-hydroxy-acid oxidizing protein [Spirochaetota bacterium]